MPAPKFTSKSTSISWAAAGNPAADYLTRLRNDRDHSSELRPRRVGEKLWALAMLELWLRAFVEDRGQRPDRAGEENYR